MSELKKNSNGMNIGFFDSGLGGLIILKAVRELLPQYDYLYYGDTAHLPYGDKSEEEIYALTEQAVIHLFEAGAVLVVIACNTASAETTRRLQQTILTGVYADRKILGVIIPTVETLRESGVRSALLIGTTRTVDSEKYNRELEKYAPDCKLISHKTPSLVPLIESGKISEAVQQAVDTIDPEVGKIDAVILGCTHYVLLKHELRKRYPNISIIAQDEIIPSKIKSYLQSHPEIHTKLSTTNSMEIILSEDNPYYQEIEKEFLAKK